MREKSNCCLLRPPKMCCIPLVSEVLLSRFIVTLHSLCLYPQQQGNVPLVAAAAKGHTEVVRKLLQLGANPNHQKMVSF